MNCKLNYMTPDGVCAGQPMAGMCYRNESCGFWVPDEAVPDQGCNKDPKSRYYDAGGIEVLDIIKAKLTPEQFKGYLLGNLIKYSCRANWKGDFMRDIEKMGFYANYMKGVE
jgi:hypothetical protein